MSTNNAVVEAAARRIYENDTNPAPWRDVAEEAKSAYRANAYALADAGLLVSELPAEPLPDQQVRIDPDGWAWQKLTTYNGKDVWRSPGPAAYPRGDADVRDLPVLAPETHLDALRAERDDLRAERDRLAARRGES